MSSSGANCCGCFSTIFGNIKGARTRARRYRRARYNEREYSIEFENLIEDDDFQPSRRFMVSEEEKDVVSKGRYDALIDQQKRTDAAIEEQLRKQEDDLRLEEEAYYQAKREAAKVSTQSKTKQTEKATAQNKRIFDSEEFTSWLSQENLEITSPELDVEDFDTFLEKVKARSLSAKNMKLTEDQSETGQADWEATLNQGLEATKIADDALSALGPSDDEPDILTNGTQEQTQQIAKHNDDDDDELLK